MVKVDVADYDSCQALARRLADDGRQIDILINNAGITRDASLRKMSYENWNEVLRSNLDSMFNMTQPLCGPMADRGWGRIVNISSVNGSKGAFGQTNYAASKAGIHGFTKALALELARKNVTVNTVSPGYLATVSYTHLPGAGGRADRLLAPLRPRQRHRGLAVRAGQHGVAADLRGLRHADVYKRQQ